MKKDFLIIGGLLAAIIGLLIFNSAANIFLRQLTPEAVTTTQVKIVDTVITAEIAKTSQSRSRGLSGREKLAENSGMLFVFDKTARYKFWMKDVNVPLDMIWIDEKKQIADITHAAQPEPGVPDNLLRIYQPATAIKYVLEVTGGLSVKNNFRIGDRVELEI